MAGEPKAGRSVQFPPEKFADAVVDWIADGKTLREFCRTEGNPSFVTVYEWMKRDEKFAERIARARESGEDVIAQECLAIADDSTNDYVERIGKNGEKFVELDSEHVQRSRLRIDTRLKLLAKWNPKKYGDKVQQEISGPDGAPVPVSITVNFVKSANGQS